MTTLELKKKLQEMYEKYGDCNIIFESNKHQYENAKLVYQEEKYEQDLSKPSIVISCFGKKK